MGVLKERESRLLVTEEEIAKNTTASELANFIKEIKALAIAVYDENNESGLILLEVTLFPEKEPSFKIARQGKLSNESLQKFYEKLLSLSALEVEVSIIEFQYKIQINEV